MSAILYEVFCMLAGKILWHWWATTKPTTSYSISKYFTIMLCTIYYKWGYSLTFKKIMTCVVHQDMTHERTELWMCFLLDYDVFIQLSQKQLLSSIHLNFFHALVLICTSDRMDLPWQQFWTRQRFEHFLKIMLDNCMFYNVKQHTQKMN